MSNDGALPNAMRKCSLSESNAALLASGQYSDITIQCGSDKYLLHRAIVCPKSKFLATACNGNFKEGQENIINLPEDDPPTFAMLLNFLYTNNYDETSNSRVSHYAKALVNANVFAMADKYDVASLSRLASDKFKVEVSFCNDTQLVDLIDPVFTTTPASCKALRSVLAHECLMYMETLRRNEVFVRALDTHADLGSMMVLEGHARTSGMISDLEYYTEEVRAERARGRSWRYVDLPGPKPFEDRVEILRRLIEDRNEEVATLRAHVNNWYRSTGQL